MPRWPLGLPLDSASGLSLTLLGLLPLLLGLAAAEERPAPVPSPPLGPPPIPSPGCGRPMTMPAGTLNKLVLPIADPLLFDPYREYMVYVPPGFDNNRPLPVIYSFHGFYSSAEAKSDTDKLIRKSEELVARNESGFILVYGQGMADCGKPSCWGSGLYPERSWNSWGQSESPGPRGHTCDQHRSRFGHYGCYTSCRKRANDPELSACFRHGKNSTYPEDQGYDHCHASTCANDTLYVDTLMRTVESKLCVDKRRQYVTGMSVGGEHDRVQATCLARLRF